MKHSVIIAGLGGQGVLTAGEVLARASLAKYEHALWFPLYTTVMRGGPAECTVVISDQKIPCQIITDADVLMITESSQLNPFEGRLKTGGTIVIEKTGLKEGPARDDVHIWPVPGVETASVIGDTQAANLVLLGAYLAITKIIPPEAVLNELESRFSLNTEKLSINTEAFKRGLRFIEQ